MVDQARGPVSLTIPEPPPPPAEDTANPDGEAEPGSGDPQDDDRGNDGDDAPSEEPEDEPSSRPCLLLCSSGRD